MDDVDEEEEKEGGGGWHMDRNSEENVLGIFVVQTDKQLCILFSLKLK